MDQDITIAYDTTLGVLPSSERILASKIYQTEHAALTSPGNGVVWGICPSANLGTALQELRAIGKTGKNHHGDFLTGTAEKKKTGDLAAPGVPFIPLTVHLFCDTLELSPGQKIDAAGNSNFNIQLFARQVKVPAPPAPAAPAPTPAPAAGTGKAAAPVSAPAKAAEVKPAAAGADKKPSNPKPTEGKAPATGSGATQKPGDTKSNANPTPKVAPAPPTLDVTLNKGSRLVLSIPGRPDKFSVRLAIPNGETLIYQWPRDGTYGVAFWEDGGKVKWQIRGPPSGSVENIDVSVLVRKDGTVKDTRLLNDFFPRLLQMQMLIASAYIERDKDLAKKLLAFITLSTSGESRNPELNFRANTLLNTLRFGSGVEYVSSLNVYECDNILKSRLSSVQAFEQALQQYSTMGINAEFRTLEAANLVSRSDDALESYRFQLSVKKREYENAKAAHSTSQQKYGEWATDSSAKGAKFRANAARFKADQEAKANEALVFGVLDVAVNIGLSIITGGFAIGGAIKSVSKVAGYTESLKALADVFEKLRECFDRIHEIMDKIKQMLKAAEDMQEIMDKLAAGQKPSTTLQPRIGEADALNATAEWSTFEVQIHRMEHEIGEVKIEGKGIDGASEFFDSLKNLVIYGKTVIQAKVNFIQKTDELATLLLQQKLEGGSRNRLLLTAQHVANNTRYNKLLERAMFDRLITVRGRAFLDILTYQSAYRYHTMSKSSPISLSPLKPIAYYLQDAADLQAAVLGFGSRITVQKRTFSLFTHGAYKTPALLASALKETGVATVFISPADLVWRRFYRVRLMRVRCFLDGVKRAETVPEAFPRSVLRLSLTSDSTFFDNDLELAKSSAGALYTPSRAYVADSRTVWFEYDPNDESRITCDGDCGLERDYTMHTPMTAWQVRIADGEYGAVGRSELDFGPFRGLRMEFLCEFVRQ